MSTRNNPFVWYELVTGNTDRAVRFYCDLYGWEAVDSGQTAMQYTLLKQDGRGVGGIFQIPSGDLGQGMKPGWMGYIAADVDTDTPRVVAAGGKVHIPPSDIPGVGRFAGVADPHGAVFVLFTPNGEEEPPTPVPAGTPGHIGWHELHAGDGEEAFGFYSKLFGWTKAEAMDMGPNGVYQIFAIDGVPCGGMMTKMPQTPAPFWQYYVNVDGLDAAIARVQKGGGQIFMGPHEVPGGSWIANGMDPEGVIFAMVSPTR
ncbi:MAG: VOC family protein [Candidatus Eisenbacteria bacterium]|uniref:VOC family protein n=1 Tax=Eiseniibacteriota bacterium TaxID=2212470 RepID=A0A956RMK4_UNCEI|nr:VOC family protein [Candidatus Eisenbacteria bacterium]